MELIKYGESALLVNFEQRIDLNINQAVLNLSNQLQALNLTGYKYSIPGYCSLTVIFDPMVSSHEDFFEVIKSLDGSTKSKEQLNLHLIIPVCYEPELALDILELSKVLQLSKEELIQKHTQHQYNIYMMGFLPGFAYMGILDENLKTSRKAKPRLKVPAGSVAIAGLQTGIYPIDSPGGWNIIGKTPIPTFDTAQDDDPFLFSLGTQVRFRAISINEFHEIKLQIKNETFDYQSLIYVD